MTLSQAERRDVELAHSVGTPQLDGAEAQALVAALVALSPYREALAPLLGEITRIALSNQQVGAALVAVEQRSGFRQAGRLSRAELGAEKAVLLSFLEHVRFASPDFLRSVGEWPPGEIRG